MGREFIDGLGEHLRQDRRDLLLTEKSELLRRELGGEFIDSYIKLKTREWDEYSRQLTPWERATTLDC
jgi:glutamine synthetase